MTKRRRLKSLTAEQQALLPVIRDKWIATGLSTEPADRQRAEAALRLAYRCAGLQDPAVMLWFDSPLAGEIAVTFINALPMIIDSYFRDSICGRASAKARVEARVTACVGKRVEAGVLAHVGKTIWASVEERVWASAEETAWESVAQRIRRSLTSVEASIGRSVGARVRRTVRMSLRVHDGGQRQVRARLYSDLHMRVWRQDVYDIFRWLNVFHGQHDSTWIGWIDAFTQFGLGDVTAPADGLIALCESCGWCWTFPNVAILTERQSQIHLDDRGRLHNPHGMAVQYPDGWGIYAWHGLSVPEAIIVNPVTVQRIRDERNAEIRRVLLERYGPDRFVADSGALPVHADECGTLYRVALDNDEPLVLVRLVNSTPEPTRERGLIQAPDGTWRKQYWLRVPPDVQTAREAVAWTFGLNRHYYWPAVET